MTTKFNQDMYAKMRAKRNEPLFALGKRGVRVVDQGLLVILTTNVPIPTRAASSATLVEEITPLKKKPRVDKGKEKASLQSSSVWDNADFAQTKAHKVFSSDELQALSEVSPNEMVGHHVHKLVQVICSSSLSLVLLLLLFIFIIFISLLFFLYD